MREHAGARDVLRAGLRVQRALDSHEPMEEVMRRIEQMSLAAEVAYFLHTWARRVPGPPPCN